MRSQRVLITGGFGFIGSNLVCRCVELGADVTVFDNLDPRCGGNEHNLDAVRPSVRIIRGDIRHADAIRTAVVDQDILFHCAAHTSHPGSLADPFYDIDVNGIGTLRVLEAIRHCNPELKLVYVGTSSQIGRMCQTPVTENHPEFPFDIYSADKTLGEKYVLVYGRVYGLRATVVRFANVCGPRAHIRTSRFGFANYFVGLALQGKEITVYGDGSQLRNLSYVDDCVAALLCAAENDKSNQEVFFATADRQYTVSEVARSVVDMIGGRIRFVEWPKDRLVIEVGDTVIGNDKIKRILGWRPHWELDRGLAATRAYYQTRLSYYF